mgnify:FL=1
MLVYLFSANASNVSGLFLAERGLNFGLGNLEFGFISLFFGPCGEVDGERGNQNHRKATDHGCKGPEELGSSVH